MGSLEEYVSHLKSDSSCASSEVLKLVASECGIDECVVDFVLENTQGDVRMAAESLQQMRGGANVPSEEQTDSAEKQKAPTSGAGLHDMRKFTAQAIEAHKESQLAAIGSSSSLKSSEYVHDDALGKIEVSGEKIPTSSSAESSGCGNVQDGDDVANFIQRYAIDSAPEPELAAETSPPFTSLEGLPTGVTAPQSQE